MKGKATIKDVAELAGVSATTVSYVLNQNEKQTISEETKARVYDAVKQLKYIPNYAARIMKNNESRCVGIVINQSLDHRRYGTIVAGILEALELENYCAIICSRRRREGQYSGYLEDCFRHHLEGLIYICSANITPSEEEVKVITANQIPLVVFDSQNQEVPYETVDIDYYNGAVNVLRTMITPEMKRLFYLRPSRRNKREEICEQAVQDVMSEHPEITCQVLCETSKEEYWRNIEHQQGITGLYSNNYYDFLIRSNDKFHNLTKQDGILASWAQWLPIIYDMTQEYGIQAKLGAFAELREEGWGKQQVVYGKYHNYQVGKLCVKLLMDVIHGDTDVRRKPVHKLLNMEIRILNG
ncbi:LacI family DNA-binding transcriptional regulator [Lacrimispora sp.]|uniref:LacI family DNA-binding transcriptional regulator n=1 Tax=Lacrimispora sp. TaxID=2719234 RepID=UPI00289A21E6|nr:LacI family DNA-binding transcriptional regulator [Lacrimispora sp.]